MAPKKKPKSKMRAKIKKGAEEQNEEEEVKATGDDYVEPFYGLIKVQVRSRLRSYNLATPLQFALVRRRCQIKPIRRVPAFQPARKSR